MPPPALTGATIRGSGLFAIDPNQAAEVLSKAAVLLADGVLKAMISARLQSAILAMLAIVGLLVPAWLAQAQQRVGDRPAAKARAAGQKIADTVTALKGNWIVRAYPGGSPVALVGIDGAAGQPRVRLVSVASPAHHDLARSTVDHDHIDDKTVHLTLRLFFLPRNAIRSIEIVVHRPEDEANPRVLRGCWFEGTGRTEGRGRVLPTTLDRTDRAALDPTDAEATTPDWEDFQRYNQTESLPEKTKILEAILEKYGNTPIAPCAAWCLAINRADARAPEAEVRGLIDQTARIAASHGRLMQIGAINVIVDELIGAPDREELVLEYGRKTVALLHPDDSPALQISTLWILTAALPKADKVDESAAMAEVRALDDRIRASPDVRVSSPLKLRKSSREPRAASETNAWARSFATARTRARAEGKLIMIALGSKGPDWATRLEAEVFARPEVVAAMGAYVPVKVDVEDGAGRSLVAQHAPELSRGYPAILFVDPASEETRGERLVGKVPGFMPAASVVEQLNTIAGLPKDIGRRAQKARPDDGDAMRHLATALAMRGRVAEAAALVDRAWGPGADPTFDRWVAVYNRLGGELILQSKWREAGEWFDKAARAAKRPIDVYNAHLGAGLAAIFQRDPDRASQELAAAALEDGLSTHERDFAKQWLDRMGRPAARTSRLPRQNVSASCRRRGRFVRVPRQIVDSTTNLTPYTLYYPDSLPGWTLACSG